MSGLSIFCISFSLAVSVLLPVGLVIFFTVRYKIHFVNVAVGVAVFIVFSLILESVMHYILLILNPSTAEFFKNPWAYGIYGSLAAGGFEECGRFLAFMFLLRKYRGWKDGVAYGLGHGGIESLFIGGLSNLNNLIYGIMLYMGLYDSMILKPFENSPATFNSLEQLKDTLQSTAPIYFAMSGFERIMALAIQLALSLLILYGIKNRKYIFLLYAILIHAVVDFPSAVYQRGMLNEWVVEGLVVIFAAVAVVFIIKSKKLFEVQNENSVTETEQLN